MAAGGVDPDEDVRLVVLPPPYMVESLQNGHDVRFDRQFSEYGCLLRQIADAVLSPQIHRQIRNIVAAQQDRTTIRAGQPDNDEERCRLACPIWSEQSNDLSLSHTEIDFSNDSPALI